MWFAMQKKIKALKKNKILHSVFSPTSIVQCDIMIAWFISFTWWKVLAPVVYRTRIANSVFVKRKKPFTYIKQERKFSVALSFFENSFIKEGCLPKDQLKVTFKNSYASMYKKKWVFSINNIYRLSRVMT